MSLPAGLFLVFLTLKLTHVIAWSWLWVSCPLWAGVAILVTLLLLGALGVGADVGVSWLLSRRRRRP